MMKELNSSIIPHNKNCLLDICLNDFHNLYHSSQQDSDRYKSQVL